MFLRSFLLVGFISVQAWAIKTTSASAPAPDYAHLEVPEVVGFSDADFQEINKKWKSDSRKIASEMSFAESDLSPDFVKMRDAWLQVKTADQMSAFLADRNANYAKYSTDTQYFLAQMLVVSDMRGIIWRMRPLFEQGPRFGGNKATHVTAVQFVRGAATGMKAAFPEAQTDAMLEYMSMPSSKMSEADQFKHMYEFQSFLMSTYAKALNTSVDRMKTILKANPTSVWKWDNKMFYGSGAFEDGINRIKGHGAAEMHTAIAANYSAIHDALVFSAYDQDDLINVISSLGRAVGIDAIGIKIGETDMGLTDQERTKIVKSSVQTRNFLHIRDYKKKKYGTELMAKAYIAKKAAVDNMGEAYNKLQGKAANTAMVLNPGLVKPDIQNRASKNIETMRAMVAGEAEVRDPVSGKSVAVNLPKFYSNPPENMGMLMANGWEGGSEEKSVTGASGKPLKARNYFRGRAISWNNSAWAPYVTSATGRDANYMSEAKRIMHYSVGSSAVFGPVDLFVR